MIRVIIGWVCSNLNKKKEDTHHPFLNVDKNSKDAFIKKLQMCMKTYDYKDEGRDVKGKVTL